MHGNPLVIPSAYVYVYIYIYIYIYICMPHDASNEIKTWLAAWVEIANIIHR